MKPLTIDENNAALDQLIAGERMALARVRLQVQLHRDVLNSPADTVTQLEAVAIKSAQAIEWLEAQYEFAPARGNGVHA